MNITYRDLLKKLLSLDLRELDQNVSVKYDGEYIPIASVKAVGDHDGVLDEGHIILIAASETFPSQICYTEYMTTKTLASCQRGLAALKVILLTPATNQYLEINDPKALKQVRDAVNGMEEAGIVADPHAYHEAV